jgi:hypothetical protein
LRVEILMSGANVHPLVPDEAPYSAWQISPRRFAITWAGEAAPIIGYAIQSQDAKSWFIERKGQVFRSTYASLEDAAEALLVLEEG